MSAQETVSANSKLGVWGVETSTIALPIDPTPIIPILQFSA